MNLTLYFEYILYDIFLFLAKIIDNALALSACKDIHECVQTTTGLVLIVRALLGGRLWLRSPPLGEAEWKWFIPTGWEAAQNERGRLSEAVSAGILPIRFLAAIGSPLRWPGIFVFKGFLPPVVAAVRDLLHSWKVLTNSAFHCMNTRKMQKAVQAAAVGEGREDSEWSRGKWGFWCCPCYFQTESSWLSKLPSTFLRLK